MVNGLLTKSTNSSLSVCPMITWNSFLSEMCNRTFYLSEEREIISEMPRSPVSDNCCMYLLKVER